MGKYEAVCDCEIIHKEKVETAKKSILDEEKLLLISDFYKALSDSTRIKIINLLEKNELCVCDISNILNMTKSAVSHQLKNLKELNLIKSKKVGKEVWYTLSDDHVKQVFDISLDHILNGKFINVFVMVVVTMTKHQELQCHNIFYR